METGVPDNSLTRASALSLVLPNNSVIVGMSAAWIHQINGIDFNVEDLFARPEFAVIDRDIHGKRIGVCQHRFQIEHRDLIQFDDVIVTSFNRTAFDLARTRDKYRALGYLDLCAATGKLDIAELSRIRMESRGYRFVRTIDAVLPHIDKGSQSMGESKTRLKMILAGLPAPKTQCPVFIPATGQTFYLDHGWQRVKVGVEFDGAADHSTPDQVAHDFRRRSLIESRGWKVFVVRTEDLGSEQWINEVRNAIESRLPRTSAFSARLSS